MLTLAIELFISHNRASYEAGRFSEGIFSVTRALHMSTKNTEKRSAVVVEDDSETDFTDRVLLSLVFDVTCLAENVERVKVQVFALAKERGIKPPKI